MIDLKNPYLETCEDFWYHIGIGPTEDVRKMFKDVKVSLVKYFDNKLHTNF